LDKEAPSVERVTYAESQEGILDLTIEANIISAGDSQLNVYEMRNALLLLRRQARVRYKNGVTLPAAATKLRADAERQARHSRILSRNIKNSTGISKHPEADAHHVVAQSAKRARRSRSLLFKWGIGINDADNGIYLPKKWTSNVPGLERATAHQNIHTGDYHLAVQLRLLEVRRQNAAIARLTLREIKSEILDNQFVY
jgi:hypothetical protein